ncbi:hypothetical protein SFC88_16380 [Nocardioides sp. HM23]|uniref:hypothetical protein n=1 Tax=Nocardioides bizhenqiangii TaxID=3095076 RepID=UPI002ACAFBAA|nr:hypothetical protein [Nocardioides sp. HM23]MDZ5622422.1 hypothetical protein [Nocardioides sp. HM23]
MTSRSEGGDPHVLAPGQAPTPFTAAEIRERCAVGKTIRVLVEIEGEAPYHRVTTYVECDDSGATIRRSTLALDHSPLAEPEIEHVTWLGLQSHASFPAADTTIESERIETALGELDCLRYTVRDGEGEKVLWFAKDLPGMPVRFLTRAGGEVVMTVSVVESSLP